MLPGCVLGFSLSTFVMKNAVLFGIALSDCLGKGNYICVLYIRNSQMTDKHFEIEASKLTGFLKIDSFSVNDSDSRGQCCQI